MSAVLQRPVERLDVAQDARRHGVEVADIAHALRHRVNVYRVSEGMTMVIGPSRAGRLLEVGLVERFAADTVVHAAPARPGFQ